MSLLVKMIEYSLKRYLCYFAIGPKSIYVSVSVPAAWIYSKYHYQMAIDPDPDYKIVINPEPYNVPEIDSLPDGLEKQLAQASFDMLSYNRAEVLSYARYVAAEEDNASEYELLQLEAVKKYNDISLEKIDTINNIYSLLIQNHTPLTDDDVAKIKKEISTNGLPTEWVNILTREGFESDIPDIIQTILDADNQNYKNPSLFIDSNIRDAQLLANLSDEYAKDIIEIKVNELGNTPTEANQTEIEKLEKLKTDIRLGLNKGYATRQLKDNIKSMSSLANALIFETNNNNYLHYLSFAMDAQVKSLTLQMPIDTDSPSSITNLQSTNGTSWINWTWTNPMDSDFNHTEIYLNGIFQNNTSDEYFNATGLQPETSYTLGTRTVDNNGNVNQTWVNSTATTDKKAIPTITWSNPADITYGTSLSSTQLNAVASVPGNFTYTPLLGTVLSAGDQQDLHVEFTPDDTINYNLISMDVKINVLKAIPTITWSNPADIIYGTALSDSQLNASASVHGTFVYTPASGTVLSAGSQKLHVDVTPDDAGNYTTAPMDVKINVLTPVQGIQLINTTVQSLFTSGKLNKGQAN